MDQQVTTSQISQFIKIIQNEQLELEHAKKELNFQISELDLIIKNLRSEFPNQFQKKLVPMGSFAFMKGTITEEKQITVFLGDDWFVKVSISQGIEILGRRRDRINEKVVLIDDELNQLRVKLQTTEGLLTGNMLGKNEDGLDFFEIRETEEDEQNTLSALKPSTSSQPPKTTQIKEAIEDDEDDDILSEEEVVIPEGASVVKLKILENNDNSTKSSNNNTPLTQEQAENKKYLDQIFANFGSDEDDDEEDYYYEENEEGEEGDENEENEGNYMGYGLNYDEDDDEDIDYDYDEDEDDDDDFETYYKNLPAWAKKALNVTSPPTNSPPPQHDLKLKKKKKSVRFAPDVEEPNITVRKPADIKHRIQQMLDQNTPNAKSIQTPPTSSTSSTNQQKPNISETMKLNVVEREVQEEEDNEEDLEVYEQKKKDLKEARDYVDRYKTKMNKFKYEHEYEEGVDRQLIRENVQLSDNIELEANYDWQERALSDAFDKQLKLDNEKDGVFSSSLAKSRNNEDSSSVEQKPKKVSKFKLSRQQK